MESVCDNLHEVFEFGSLVKWFSFHLNACIFIFGRRAGLRLRDEDVNFTDWQIDCNLKEYDIIWIENGKIETQSVISEGSGEVILGFLLKLLLALISKLLCQLIFDGFGFSLFHLYIIVNKTRKYLIAMLIYKIMLK